MKYNIRPDKVYRQLHSLCAPQDLRFIGKIISSLKLDAEKKICWALIRDWKERGYDLTEIVFSIMRLLKGAEILLLFKRIGKNKTRVNLRANSGIDVNKIAKFFGGGGHKRASGATIEEDIQAAQEKVISFVRRLTANSCPRPK